MATRTHVTIEYRGDAPAALPKIWGRDGAGRPVPVQFTLKPGDNTISIAYWHAVGASAEVQALIATGKVTPVCREHRFEERDDLALVVGFIPVLCRSCGHSPESAAAALASAVR